MPKEISTHTRDGIPVVILKHNVGMVRDAWIEDKEGEGRFFIVRQVAFDVKEGDNGIITKLFRFDEAEVKALIELFNTPPPGFPK